MPVFQVVKVRHRYDPSRIDHLYLIAPLILPVQGGQVHTRKHLSRNNVTWYEAWAPCPSLPAAENELLYLPRTEKIGHFLGEDQ